MASFCIVVLMFCVGSNDDRTESRDGETAIDAKVQGCAIGRVSDHAPDLIGMARFGGKSGDPSYLRRLLKISCRLFHLFQVLLSIFVYSALKSRAS